MMPDKITDPYDKKTDKEDRIWLAAELFKTTGDKQYEEYLRSQYGKMLTRDSIFFSWTNTLAFGQWAYVTYPHADPLIKGQVKTAFTSYADSIVRQIAADGYGCALLSSEYTWGSKSAAAKANMLLMANRLEPKPEYVRSALEQVHYL